MHQETDLNLVEMWLRKDPTRWMAGVLGGIFSGGVAILVGGLISKSHGLEFVFPIKFAALPIVGNAATAVSPGGSLMLGLFLFLGLAAFLGFLFSHFTPTNMFAALLGMGFVWGTFSWIFITNLFMQSWVDIRATDIPNSATFFVTLSYGLSLVSVGMFDKMIRR